MWGLIMFPQDELLRRDWLAVLNSFGSKNATSFGISCLFGSLP
jgi:hypothetical protein